jgi:hypothetical protein
MQLLGKQRPGVPQFPQPHVLLRRGLVELGALFGDFQAKLVAEGAVPLNWLENSVVVRQLHSDASSASCAQVTVACP